MAKDWSQVFSAAEWRWIKKLGGAFTDPEQKREFWNTVREKKEADPSYSVFTDFPQSHDDVDFGIKVCQEILKMLETKGYHGTKKHDMDAEKQMEKGK